MLKNFINHHINDIIISGYTEKINSTYFFRPMNWWVYLIMDKNIIELFSGDGNILIKKIEVINCNFDIEDDDIFTLTSFTKEDIGLMQNIEYYYDDDKNLVKILIFTSNLMIEFDALSLDGFQILTKINKVSILT
jgi:hypothetical protein